MRWRAASVLALALLLGPGRGAAGESAPPRPPDALAVADPIHADLEALAARGVLVLPDLRARPLLRHDVARALAAALRADPGLAGDPAFERARRAFAPEIDVFEQRDPGGLQKRSLISLADEDNWLRVESFVRVNAEAAPDRGFVLTDSTRFGLAFSWILWPGFHLYEELYVADIDGGKEFGDPLLADTNIIIFQDRAYAGLATRYADVVFGRDRLGWGRGATGTLLLSPTARPFTHLRLSRTFFGGRFHAVMVNGVLNRAEGRYVAFHRLDWAPSRRIRIGLAEGARYDASGFEPLYLAGIIPYPVVGRLLERDNEDRATDEAVRNNVMWDADFSVKATRGLDLYGEILLDDVGTGASGIPTRLAYQLGAYGVREALGRELRLRLEWTRVWNYTYSTYYGIHFDHEGEPLGYPYGPDSRVAHARADMVWNRDWTLSGVAERIDRGEGRLRAAWDPGDPAMSGADPGELSGVVEREWRLLAGARYAPSATLELAAEVGPAFVSNAGHEPGAARRGLTGRLGFAYRR